MNSPRLTSGSFRTAREVTPRPIVRTPFKRSDSPDLYARTLARIFKVTPFRSPSNARIATRTSYTNHRTYSEDFANAAWTKPEVTIAAAARVNPWDGTATFSSVLEKATTALHDLSGAHTFTAVPHTVMALVAGGLGRTYARLKANDGTTDFIAFFDLASGVVFGPPSNCTATIKRYDDGSFKLAITFTPLAAVGTVTLAPSTNGSTVSYLGDTAKGLYVGGIQIERASAAGPYIVTASAARTVTAPDVDGLVNAIEGDDFAFLVDEDDLTDPATAAQPFNRLYARIPRPQVNYPGSRHVSLPSAANYYGTVDSLTANEIGANATLGRGYYLGSAIYTSLDKKLYRAKAVTSTTPGKALSGNFTIGYGANSTSNLAYNASAATILAAINALASVIADGITVGVGNTLPTNGLLALSITFSAGVPAAWPKYFTMDATGLTVTTSKNPITSVSIPSVGISASQIIYLPDHHTITAHGFDTAKRLASVNANNYSPVYPSAKWGSIDANTLWLPSAAGVPVSYLGDYIGDIDLSGGSRLVRHQVTETFALPGFTPGITTPTDIAVDVGHQNPVDFFAALVNTTGWQTRETDGPAQWLGRPIYRLETTKVYMADFFT